MPVRQPRVENEKPILRWCAVHLDLAQVLLVVWKPPCPRFFCVSPPQGGCDGGSSRVAMVSWRISEGPYQSSVICGRTRNREPLAMLSPCALLVNLADTAGSPGGQPLTETKGPQDWSHIDPCFLSSRGFGRRSGPRVCWREGCCFEPQPSTPPPTARARPRRRCEPGNGTPCLAGGR